VRPTHQLSPGKFGDQHNVNKNKTKRNFHRCIEVTNDPNYAINRYFIVDIQNIGVSLMETVVFTVFIGFGATIVLAGLLYKSWLELDAKGMAPILRDNRRCHRSWLIKDQDGW